MMESIVNEYFVNTSRSSKSRKTSYSSLLNDSNYNNPKQYHDRLSLKKLAKQYSRSLWNSNNNNNNSKSSNPDTIQQGDPSKFETFFFLQNMTKRYKNKNQDLNNNTSDSSFWKSYFDKFQANQGNDESDVTESPKYQVKPSNPIDIPESNNYNNVSQVRPNTADSYILSRNDNITNMMNNFQIDTNKTVNFNEEGKRVVQFRNFHHLVGINSLLSQISGGPLEKLVLNNSNMKDTCVEVWFLKSCDAEDFLNYSQSGLFLVNGFYLRAEWAPRSTDLNYYHIEPEIRVEDEMVVNGASRCLILKKYISKKTSNKKVYPVPSKNYSDDLRISEIQNDLNRFGSILEISPVISKKLCIAIYFFETQSAIAAKKEFDDKTSDFYEKYKDWTFWYGKDPCDRPCLNL